MRTPAETEQLKRELVDEFRRILQATADKDAAVMLALVKLRQLLDIIYPPAPRNDMADALAFAMTPWQADAGAQERARGHPLPTRGEPGMSGTRTYIVPPKAANDGWTQIPQWLFTEARCVPMPPEEWTLPDGSVAHAGDTIRLRDGAVELIRATQTAEKQTETTV